jgi:hypothetical protein
MSRPPHVRGPPELALRTALSQKPWTEEDSAGQPQPHSASDLETSWALTVEQSIGTVAAKRRCWRVSFFFFHTARKGRQTKQGASSLKLYDDFSDGERGRGKNGQHFRYPSPGPHPQQASAFGDRARRARPTAPKRKQRADKKKNRIACRGALPPPHALHQNSTNPARTTHLDKVRSGKSFNQRFHYSLSPLNQINCLLTAAKALLEPNSAHEQRLRGKAKLVFQQRGQVATKHLSPSFAY